MIKRTIAFSPPDITEAGVAEVSKVLRNCMEITFTP